MARPGLPACLPAARRLTVRSCRRCVTCRRTVKVPRNIRKRQAPVWSTSTTRLPWASSDSTRRWFTRCGRAGVGRLEERAQRFGGPCADKVLHHREPGATAIDDCWQPQRGPAHLEGLKDAQALLRVHQQLVEAVWRQRHAGQHGQRAHEALLRLLNRHVHVLAAVAKGVCREVGLLRAAGRQGGHEAGRSGGGGGGGQQGGVVGGRTLLQRCPWPPRISVHTSEHAPGIQPPGQQPQGQSSSAKAWSGQRSPARQTTNVRRVITPMSRRAIKRRRCQTWKNLGPAALLQRMARRAFPCE